MTLFISSDVAATEYTVAAEMVLSESIYSGSRIEHLGILVPHISTSLL